MGGVGCKDSDWGIWVELSVSLGTGLTKVGYMVPKARINFVNLGNRKGDSRLECTREPEAYPSVGAEFGFILGAFGN